MSKLEEALAKIPATRKGARCSIYTLYETLPDNERAALEKVIEDVEANRVAAAAISQAMSSAYGIDIHRASIDRHRRRECLCGRGKR
jgi:hypothetical protein